MIVERHIDIAAPLADVAATVLDFEALGRWHPGVERFHVEGGVRRYFLGGQSILERLDELDEDGGAMSLTIVNGPLPVPEIGVRYAVEEGPKPGTTRVRWAATFSANKDLAEAFGLAASGMEQATLELLKAKLEGLLPST
jgi:hypothetical protein